MAQYLTQEWLDRRRELLGAVSTTGPTIAVEVVVTKAPGGDVRFVDRYDSGRLVASDLATAAASDAELTLTAVHDDAVEIARGDLDPNAAYMQGRIKTAGPTGPLLGLLAGAQQPERRAALAQLAADTTF